MPTINQRARATALATLLATAAPFAAADSVTDWNARAGALMGEAKMGTPPAVRTIALVQTAVHEGVQRVSPQPAAADAAVAAANRAVLARVLPPTLHASLDAAYREALAKLPEGAARDAGIAAGEQAAASVLARRAHDVPHAGDDYRPHTTRVPTCRPRRRPAPAGGGASRGSWRAPPSSAPPRLPRSRAPSGRAS